MIRELTLEERKEFEREWNKFSATTAPLGSLVGVAEWAFAAGLACAEQQTKLAVAERDLARTWLNEACIEAGLGPISASLDIATCNVLAHQIKTTAENCARFYELLEGATEREKLAVAGAMLSAEEVIGEAIKNGILVTMGFDPIAAIRSRTPADAAAALRTLESTAYEKGIKLGYFDSTTIVKQNGLDEQECYRPEAGMVATALAAHDKEVAAAAEEAGHLEGHSCEYLGGTGSCDFRQPLTGALARYCAAHVARETEKLQDLRNRFLQFLREVDEHFHHRKGALLYKRAMEEFEAMRASEKERGNATAGSEAAAPDAEGAGQDAQTCTHERLNEEGICRSCGADKRGIG